MYIIKYGVINFVNLKHIFLSPKVMLQKHSIAANWTSSFLPEIK